MDVTRMLEADHRMVEGLFVQIESAEGQERAALVTELAEALNSHMELEETVVYPAMAPVTGDDKVESGVAEHELARKGLADLVAQTPDGPGFGAALDAVKAGIEHHVKEEEDEIFPKLRTDGAEIIESLTTPVMTKRQQLRMQVNTSALSEGATKDQLAEEAEGLDIDGAASMRKDELATALAAAGDA
jgi:iron-sulfur cluster repair protein YtfE (RIC family)